ncbi:hypothetical protein [Neptunomonas sp.]|uniref:hypothetical protein n=1 Tax=Neptunomonas sp. TaxID=1971898 RepID=UPI003568EC55
MYPIIRNPEEWVEQQNALLDSYIERVFESETIDDWFSCISSDRQACVKKKMSAD